MVKAQKGSVYYCDTDSLFVNANGKENLIEMIDDNKLGFLKQEEILHNLEIFGPKDYKAKEKERHKGVPKNAKKIKENVWEYYRWDKTATFIRKNSLNQYYNTKTIKVLLRRYLKGWVLEDGNVVPFILEVKNGENKILEWERTRYAKEGKKLKDIKQKEWVEKEFS